MKSKNLLKLAIVGGLLATTCNYSFAADNASVTVSGTLASFLEVTGNTPAAGTIDTGNGSMTSPPEAIFTISTNRRNVDMELIARVEDDGAVQQNAFFTRGGTKYIALGNTTALERPNSTSITNLVTTTDPTDNPNVIGYALGSVTYNGSAATDTTFPTNFTFDTVPGNKTANVPLTGTISPSSYSLEDTFGTYSAIITCQIYTP